MAASNNSSDDGITITVVSSGSSEGCSELPIDDERKRRRRDSNRESARRSRIKKQEHLDGLLKQIGYLIRQNEEILKKIGEIGVSLEVFESENAVLRAMKNSLETRLVSLESVIEIVKVVRGGSTSSSSSAAGGGFNDDGVDNNNKNSSDPMMKPWQLPCPSMPITIHSFKDYNF
ncbi:hypothetical protein SOVF_026350 [Spinacia oleracea]|uniref:BZIP transcription factor 53 n=1 Tax=Spinacia oleracea TaxID=3562 RepID=A0A9R0HZZ3_SPIOL|nr:bZIP transcription factor 53-like [Spinacia oleracea]KNA23253.1 hypothetical protein SOVF_026350 [Spinacia oleracea]